MAKGNGGTRSVSRYKGVVNISNILTIRDAQSHEFEQYYGSAFMFGREMELPISYLIPTQDTVDMNKVNGIMKNPSIIDRKDGWNGKSSIEVIEHNGKYYLNDGHHRVVAAKMLNRKKVVVNVIKK